MFKITLPSPKEKALQLKKRFGDEVAVSVINEMYLFGSANGLREELMYLNSVEAELTYGNLNTLVRRLKKLNITIQIAANYPWMYLKSINGKPVTEKRDSEHGFVVGYKNPCFKFNDTKEMFNLIRKYL